MTEQPLKRVESRKGKSVKFIDKYGWITRFEFRSSMGRRNDK